VATTAHILLADRDPALRRVLTHRLEAEGLTVRSFEDRTIPSSSAYESTRACRPSVDRRWVPQYVFDGLTIDPGRREVFVDGVQVDLTVTRGSCPSRVHRRRNQRAPSVVCCRSRASTRWSRSPR